MAFQINLGDGSLFITSMVEFMGPLNMMDRFRLFDWVCIFGPGLLLINGPINIGLMLLHQN